MAGRPGTSGPIRLASCNLIVKSRFLYFKQPVPPPVIAFPQPSPIESHAMRATNDTKKKPKDAALVGLAFDAADGQTRLTRGKNFVLCGGSSETHECMQETAVKINEHLDRRGRRLEDVSIRELRDICDNVER